MTWELDISQRSAGCQSIIAPDIKRNWNIPSQTVYQKIISLLLSLDTWPSSKRKNSKPIEMLEWLPPPNGRLHFKFCSQIPFISIDKKEKQNSYEYLYWFENRKRVFDFISLCFLKYQQWRFVSSTSDGNNKIDFIVSHHWIVSNGHRIYLIVRYTQSH